eukprot:6178345-Pleurochrysis_carterae.AAC.1
MSIDEETDGNLASDETATPARPPGIRGSLAFEARTPGTRSRYARAAARRTRSSDRDSRTCALTRTSGDLYVNPRNASAIDVPAEAEVRARSWRWLHPYALFLRSCA